MNTIEILNSTQGGAYDKAFWDSMRLKNTDEDIIRKGKVLGAGTYFLPMEGNKGFVNQRSEYATLRSFATEIKHYQGGADILSAYNEDYAEFVPEGGMVPEFDVRDDFTKMRVQLFKVAALLKMPMELIYDASFDIKKYLIKRMARAFARAEDRAFINGMGINEPTGLLHATDGVDVATTVDHITYDTVIELFFSVKPEYRKKAVWIMNDNTALALRKMKDADGNYLWNQVTDTILGKPVVICNEMPDAEGGKKPILFGDLSYYWIIDRSPVSMKTLQELFAVNNQVGYLGYEFMDAKLICKDAVKGVAICDTL